jgi:transcriptional regulator with XRE-family HTH domain
MDYGQKIAELRKSNKLTQAELGAKLNITAQAVSKWENNLSEPDIESIRMLCEIFEISVDEFLGGSFSKKQPAEPAPAPQPVQQEKVKIINGYCEKCKKPVGPGEYKIGYFTYNPTSLTSKVQRAENQHIYCNACHLELTKLKSKEAQNRVVATQIAEKAERVESIKKGLLWGILPAAIILFASLIYFLKP